MNINIKKLNIEDTHKALVSHKFSVWDLVNECLKNEKENRDLNAFIEIFDEKYLKEQVEEAQKKIDSGDAHFLTGIPIAVKDNILIKGQKCSAGSKILKDYTATYDATVIKKLKEVGAILIGRTNMDEFAMGSSTETSAYGVCKNPHDPKRVPGGSSGGSVVAVRTGMCMLALGSDTGGSVRQPSALCGVVGLKPTYGSVSRNGLIALGSSFDVIGSIGKTVEDVQILFNTLKGKDPMDSTSIKKNNELKNETKEVKTIGVPKFIDEIKGMDMLVENNFKESISKLKKAGYKIKEIDLPHLKYAIPVYYITLPAEASANLARFDGVRYGLHEEGDNGIEDYFKTKGKGFGAEPRRRIILGTYVLSAGYYDAYYNKAQAVRGLIRRDFDKAFKEVDAIITPTTAGPAFKIGEKINDPVQMYLEDIFTVSANLSGIPAISVPSNQKEDGSFEELPLGLHIIAPHLEEEKLFQIAKKFLGEK